MANTVTVTGSTQTPEQVQRGVNLHHTVDVTVLNIGGVDVRPMDSLELPEGVEFLYSSEDFGCTQTGNTVSCPDTYNMYNMEQKEFTFVFSTDGTDCNDILAIQQCISDDSAADSDLSDNCGDNHLSSVICPYGVTGSGAIQTSTGAMTIALTKENLSDIQVVMESTAWTMGVAMFALWICVMTLWLFAKRAWNYA